MTDREPRYFIVSDGRSGSSLLTSILGRAGADFGLSIREQWDPASGANEVNGLRALSLAVDRAERMTFYQEERLFGHLMARTARSIAKRRARRFLRHVRYTKASAYLAPYAYKLGYAPYVIANYRRFGPLTRSKMLLQRMTWPRVAQQYEITFRNSLVAIHTFGGCTVSFEELVDPGETAWADALAGTTGLDRDTLLRARDDLNIGAPAAEETYSVDPRMDALYDELRALKGMAVPPSRQFQRV